MKSFTQFFLETTENAKIKVDVIWKKNQELNGKSYVDKDGDFTELKDVKMKVYDGEEDSFMITKEKDGKVDIEFGDGTVVKDVDKKTFDIVKYPV